MSRPTKKLALDAIVDCLTSAEADGYQQHEAAHWPCVLTQFYMGNDGNLRLEFMDTVFRINITKERGRI